MKRIGIWLAVAVAGFSFFCSPILAAIPGRQRLTMDFGWKFLLGDPANAQTLGFNADSWTAVDLPHDWSIFGPFDRNAPAGGGGGYLPTGIGWYRKTFKVPDDYQNRNISIEFDGVYENSEVWINGHSLGKRPYGYESFVYDLTPFLNFDQRDNVIAVRVDNSLQPNSRWYSGSGIYRHTWLLISDGLHIPQWGTFVAASQVTAAAATLDVSVRVINQRRTPAKFDLIFSVLDQQNRPVSIAPSQMEQTGVALEAGGQKEFARHIEIDGPTLWSIENPYLYTLRCQVREGDRVVDEYETPFGIRTAVFDVSKGFLLDGNHVKLNGVCLHGDGGGVGTAVPEGVWARRLQLLKEMGCNAIRTSHNPPAPEFLDCATRWGFW